MSVFNAYAQYYDLLYQDKNYSAEADFVTGLIRRYSDDPQHILELGCGTGIHAEKLFQAGFSVHGIDFSREMLVAAEARTAALDPEQARRLSFSYADITSFRQERDFDVVISLFHVISYQISDEALLAAFKTAADHLQPGGVFIFDCWYGPAVLTDRPEVRIKRLEDEQIAVTRIAEPVVHANLNQVDVNYGIFVTDKISGQVDQLSETHQMRYLFHPEVQQLCRNSGFELLTAAEWLTDKEPGFQTWGVYFVVRKT